MAHRIALRLDGPLARRVRRCLLAERDVEVGLLVDDPGDGSIPTVAALDGWDALAVDQISGDSRRAVDQALERRIPVVSGEGLPAWNHPAGGTLVTGVLTGAGLAAALAVSAAPDGPPPAETRLAWTVPGDPLAGGIPVAFPEPVGPLWAGRAEHPLPWPSVTGLAAPHCSQWRGATARLRIRGAEAERDLVRGVVDDADFLDAVCMSAAALAAAQGAYPEGVNSAGDPNGLFLRLARRAGLEEATFAPG